MPERKQLAKISRVTDDDTGMYRIGEVEGAFQQDQLKEFISRYGKGGLLSTLAYMTHQVVSAAREVNQGQEGGESNQKDPPT
jgi:hypothetical protein